MVASSAHAATSTITEAVAPSELLSSSTVTAKANAVMATPFRLFREPVPPL